MQVAVQKHTSLQKLGLALPYSLVPVKTIQVQDLKLASMLHVSGS